MIHAAVLLASTFTSAEPAAQAWYERQSCMSALESILSIDFETAEPKIKAIEKSGDPDDQACGVWLRVNLSEAQLAVGGHLPALLDYRERMLKRMYGFSKAKGALARRFADLEIEARLRRVRVLVDKDEKSDALKEIQHIDELLEKRGSGDVNPTLMYSRGVSDTAVGDAPWALRTLMRMAGVKGDAERGHQLLAELEKGATIYKYDAVYLQHYFSVGTRSVQAKKLADKFPTNPQFAIELARDLYEEKKAEQALAAVAHFTTELEKNPALYSSQLRANLYVLCGQCAKELGKRDLVKRYASLAEAQSYAPLKDEIQDLKGE